MVKIRTIPLVAWQCTYLSRVKGQILSTDYTPIHLFFPLFGWVVSECHLYFTVVIITSEDGREVERHSIALYSHNLAEKSIYQRQSAAPLHIRVYINYSSPLISFITHLFCFFISKTMLRKNHLICHASLPPNPSTNGMQKRQDRNMRVGKKEGTKCWYVRNSASQSPCMHLPQPHMSPYNISHTLPSKKKRHTTLAPSLSRSAFVCIDVKHHLTVS